MVFTRVRHPFLRLTIDTFISGYAANAWEKNGPLLIKRIIKEYCHVNSYMDIDLYGFKVGEFADKRSMECNDLAIFPEWYFYPLTFSRDEHFELFKPGSSGNPRLVGKMKNAYSMHYYNQLSSKTSAKFDDKSLFTQKAEENCIYVFDYAKNKNLIFS